MKRNLILKLSIIFIIFLLVTIPILFSFKINKDSERLYIQGMEYYSNEDYSNAFYNFNLIKPYAKLYPLALLKQFQCANNLQDKKTAQKKIKELVKITKDGNIRPYVLYNDAILNQELKNDAKSKQIKKFKYIQEKYPETDFGIASSFKYASLVDDLDKPSAKYMYIKYLTYAPTGKYAAQALNNLVKFKNYITKEDRQIIANAYLENGNYKNALDNYLLLNFSDNWYDISKCYRHLNNISKEKEIILLGLNLTNSQVDEKNISNAIDRLIKIANADKIQTLQDLYTKYPNTYITPTVMYKLAESITSIRSIKFYEAIVSDYKDSIWASNSLWELFWYNYKQKRYKTCETLAKGYLPYYKDSKDAPRIYYWFGKALLKEKKSKNAKEIFTSVVNDYPLSYYAFLSMRQLRISKSKKLISSREIKSYDINTINKFLFKNSILELLANYNDYTTIDDLKIEDEYIKSWIAYKKEMYSTSINIAKNEYLDLNKKDAIDDSKDKDKAEDNSKITYSDWQLKLMYPIVYEDKINRYTKEYNLSPYLFLALIREESHFNSLAKSSVGAMGLSQLMPDTANFIAKKVVSKDEIYDSDYNIKLGTQYFKYLVNYFDGNEYLSVLSYNAGPGNIDKWIQNIAGNTSDLDYFIEEVPFLETKTYIKKILSSYWVYINIYKFK